MPSKVLKNRLGSASRQVKVGELYRHYKNREAAYKVLHLAITEWDDEVCVIYQAQYGDGLIFVRPLASWLSEVDWQGGKAKRITNMGNKNELELIARILDGDGELYGQLIDRYKNGLYYHCFGIVHNEDAAEDIAQETFIHAYQQLNKYDMQHKFSTWLFKIATNKAIDHLRIKRPLPLSDKNRDAIVSSLPTSEQKYAHRELRDAVRALPPHYRSVICLHYWHGMQYDEIATVMDAPLGSIKSWLYRAKKQLKEALS